MIFIRGDKLSDNQIDRLYELHREVSGYTDLSSDFVKLLINLYILVDQDSDSIFGYIHINPISNDTIKVEWIYGPGYGRMIMFNIEHHFKQKGYKLIILNCSIDPQELKQTVMRRLNFYIKNKYRVHDIEFRNEHGPLLKMEKSLI